MSKKKNLTLSDAYRFYLEKNKNSKTLLDYKSYREVCGLFNKILMKKIIEEGYFFKVPYRIGIIRIKKRKINLNNLKKDYGLFNKSDGKFKNEHLNEHTSNQYVRFYWSKFYTDNMVKNKTWYAFVPTRSNKRYLASLLKDKGNEQINKYFD